MGRIRSIHPEQWTDEAFVVCSPLARLLAIALRNEADDNGVFEWKPRALKMRLLPADACDITALLDELVTSSQVSSFDVNGKKYGLIRNFKKYQRPRKPQIRFPEPPSVRQKSEPVPQKSGISTADGEEEGRGIGEETKEEANASSKSAMVDADVMQFVAENELNADPFVEIAKFEDWKLAKGRRFRSDKAAFRNWLRKASEINNERGVGPRSARVRKPSQHGQISAEPWEQRMRGWRKNQFWQAEWGFRPGERGCRVPDDLLLKDEIAAKNGQLA